MRGLTQWVGGRRGWWPLSVVMIAGILALAGCGASAGSQTAASANFPSHGSAGGTTASYGSNNSSTTGVPVATQAAGSSDQNQQNLGPNSYLIKSLVVQMSVPDPRAAASDIQQWITTTDPHAVSAGATYQRQGDGSYTVQMSFSVEEALYPQVESYLAGYTSSHKGHLDNLQESVQDVSNEYVDLQSRLTNLRTEQQRLLGLLAHAASLSDTLAIDNQLTQVEGEIEQIEGRQNQLNGQLSYYTVTINLAPLGGAAKSPPAPPYNPVGIFQSALNAALTFGQWLLAAIIWIGVFAVYIVPVLAIAWFIRWRLRLRKPASATP